MLPPAITYDSSNTPPNWSMIAELFPTQERNARQRINDDAAYASSIIIEQDVLNNQAAEASQYEASADNNFDILNSSDKYDE